MRLTIPRWVRGTSGQVKGSGGTCISRPWVDKDAAQVNLAWHLSQFPKLFEMLVNVYEYQMTKLYVLSLYSLKRT